MRRNEIAFAVICALFGAGIAYFARLVFGSWPSPVIYYAIVVIGLGAALVAIRYGRLGPFEGEFGSPRFESELRESIRKETERAMRYGHQFSVLAVRQDRGPHVNWHRGVRGVDHVLPCRKGVVMLLLPETSREGALILLGRFASRPQVALRAALVNCPDDGRTGDDLSAAILRLARQATASGTVVMRTGGSVQALPIATAIPISA